VELFVGILVADIQMGPASGPANPVDREPAARAGPTENVKSSGDS